MVLSRHIWGPRESIVINVRMFCAFTYCHDNIIVDTGITCMLKNVGGYNLIWYTGEYKTGQQLQPVGRSNLWPISLNRV